jgi:hypothetical protein
MTLCKPAVRLWFLLAIGLYPASLLAAEPPPAPPASTGQVEKVPPDHVLAVLGRTVSTQDGKPIGRLVDVLVDDSGAPEAGVIDFGGFMGVGARKVAVHWSALHFTPGNAKQPITLELTPDQIKAVPEYREKRPAPIVVPATTESPAPAGDTAAGSH